MYCWVGLVWPILLIGSHFMAENPIETPIHKITQFSLKTTGLRSLGGHQILRGIFWNSFSRSHKGLETYSHLVIIFITNKGPRLSLHHINLFCIAQPSELGELVLAAHVKGDQDQIDGLLCGAMKTLKLNRLKPDPMLYLTLLNLAKEKPTLFTTKRVLEVNHYIFLKLILLYTLNSLSNEIQNALLHNLISHILKNILAKLPECIAILYLLW